MITHRLISMERMDEILVLDHGRICQRGTHEQLLHADGLYRQLFEVQNTMLVFS
jgi:ABC-type multidrug transport system fused ATPase/permease subunit